METQWYYTDQGQRVGPVSAAQLKERAASGRLQPTDMVWKEGMTQWAAVGQVKGLLPAARKEQTSVVSPPPMLTPEPRIGGGLPTRFRIELVPQRRDIAETARMSAMIGFGTWLVWAIGFSFLYAALENLSFDRVFPVALKTGVLFGLLMALVAPFSLVCVRATIQFSDKKDFVARLNMATSQLGYVAASVAGDFMTFRPSFKTAVDLLLGPTSVQLEHDHAMMSGPKMHVKKILKRLETS